MDTIRRQFSVQRPILWQCAAADLRCDNPRTCTCASSGTSIQPHTGKGPSHQRASTIDIPDIPRRNWIPHHHFLPKDVPTSPSLRPRSPSSPCFDTPMISALPMLGVEDIISFSPPLETITSNPTQNSPSIESAIPKPLPPYIPS